MTVRELNQGGIERDVAKVALHMDRKRFEPHVASYFAHGMRYEELRQAGVPYLHLPMRSLLSFNSFHQAVTLWRYVRRHRIQIVHAWDTSGVFIIPTARWMGVPVVISSLLGSRVLLDERSRKQWRLTDRMADAIVVNCEAMRRHLIDDEGASGARIELCYNGVDTSIFFPKQEPRPPELASASFVIGAVCALRPEKALEVLQAGFAKVRSLRPGMKLVIVGSGPELEKLQTNARRLGIAEENIFVPATPEVAKYLRAFDVFVLSSSNEAFSNSLLEAMACGCCPVGSRVGGTPELIGEDEQRGLLFPSGDAEALAAQLSRLITHPDLRMKLAGQAAGHALRHLNMDVHLNRLTQIYESLASSRIARK